MVEGYILLMINHCKRYLKTVELFQCQPNDLRRLSSQTDKLSDAYLTPRAHVESHAYVYVRYPCSRRVCQVNFGGEHISLPTRKLPQSPGCRKSPLYHHRKWRRHISVSGIVRNKIVYETGKFHRGKHSVYCRKTELVSIDDFAQLVEAMH